MSYSILESSFIALSEGNKGSNLNSGSFAQLMVEAGVNEVLARALRRLREGGADCPEHEVSIDSIVIVDMSVSDGIRDWVRVIIMECCDNWDGQVDILSEQISSFPGAVAIWESNCRISASLGCESFTTRSRVSTMTLAIGDQLCLRFLHIFGSSTADFPHFSGKVALI
jgi:hypothetical protein